MVAGVRVAIGPLLFISVLGADLARLSARPPAGRLRPESWSGGLAAQTAGAFKSQIDLVALYVTVTDANGRLLTGLTREDFALVDQGQPQEIDVFSTEPQPLSIVVMLDYSGSMSRHRQTIGQAAGGLVDRLLPEDRARVGAFPNGHGLFWRSQVLFEPSVFTSNREQLNAVLVARAESIDGSGSPIWEAVDRSLDALAVETSRRVIVLLSDGHDNQSASRFERVLERVREMRAWVYTIGFANTANLLMTARAVRPAPELVNARTPPIDMRAERANPIHGQPRGHSSIPERDTIDRAAAATASPPLSPEVSRGVPSAPPAARTMVPHPRLSELAAASGGRYFDARGSSDFATIFTDVIDELHSQYLLGFVPAVLDGTTHTVEVRVRVPGAKVYTRPTYVARRR
jgi:VWFA-related protein